MSDSLPPRPLKGVVAVILDQDRLLVIRRSQLVRAPGMLCFPGGGIEPGEDEPQALRRELREELAVEVAGMKRLWQSVTSWGVELAWWYVALPADARLRPNSAEVEAVYWLTAREMSDQPDLLPSNHDFLAALTAGEFMLTVSDTAD